MKKKQLSYKQIFYILIGVLAIVMFCLAPKVGDDADGSYDGENGKWALKYYTEGDTSCVNYAATDIKIPGTGASFGPHMKYYGVGFEILPAIAVKYFNAGYYEYEIRHILSVFFGILFILFTALIAKEIKNYQVAILAMLACVFSPAIFNWCFWDHKNIPTAAGYAIAIFGFLKIYKTLPHFKWKDILISTLGIAIAISIRVTSLMLLFYYAVGVLLLFFFNKNFKKTILSDGKTTLKIIGISIGFCLIGAFLGLCFYPNFFHSGPVSHISEAFKVLSDFSHRIPMLWDGELTDNLHLPAWFILKSMLYNIPLWIYGGAILFLVNIKRIFKTYSVFELCFLLFTIVFPIAYLIMGTDNPYISWIHIAFVYVSFVPLCAIGIYETGLRFNKKAGKYIYPVVVAGCIFPTAKWMISHTNVGENVYYNVLLGDPYAKYDMGGGTNLVSCYEWLVKNRLNDTTKQYTVMSKNANVVVRNEVKKRKHINCFAGGVRGFAQTECDYAILDLDWMPPKVIKTFFPPKRTIYSVKIDGKPVCFVVEKNPLDAKGIQLVSQNNFDEGMQALESAYADDPNNFGLWYWMGIGYYYTKQYEKSIEFFTKHVNFWPAGEDMLFAMSHIGAAYTEIGQYDMALSVLQQASQNNASNREQLQPIISNYMRICMERKKAASNG